MKEDNKHFNKRRASNADADADADADTTALCRKCIDWAKEHDGIVLALMVSDADANNMRLTAALHGDHSAMKILVLSAMKSNPDLAGVITDAAVMFHAGSDEVTVRHIETTRYDGTDDNGKD